MTLCITSIVVLATLLTNPARSDQGIPEGETFSRVRYLGGAPNAPDRALGWDNTLTIGPAVIRLKLAMGTVVDIVPSSVTALTYAGVRHTKRWDELVPGVFGVLNYVDMKRKNHFLTIEYTRQDEKPVGVLLELHQDNVMHVIEALEQVTKTPGQTLRH